VDNLLKRYPVVQQFTKFVVIGVINTGVDFLVLNLEMMLTGISKGPYMLVQNAISFSIATINSYFFNKYWTFQDSSKKDAGKKFSQFLAVSVVGVAINSLVVFAITTYIPPMFGISSVLWANLAKLAATGISLIWNFAGYKFWVFKK
jgi:putative flippase GtrA